MKITTEEVGEVALLARLVFTEAEQKLFTGQLNTILDYFDKLKKVDTSEIDPTSHAGDISNVLRDDKTRPSISKEESLLNAPDGQGGYFRVPKIIE